MNKAIGIPIFALILLLIDLYLFQGIKKLTQNLSFSTQRIIYFSYWTTSILLIVMLFAYNFLPVEVVGAKSRKWMLVIGFAATISKIFGIIPLLIDDIIRLFKWLYQVLSPPQPIYPEGKEIPRSEFLAKSSVALATLPLVTMSYGIISGAHDYRVRKEVLSLPNLPREFDGFRIAQISDVHSGSFFNKTAVKGGIELLNAQKPDIAFFTGDLVNNKAEEVKDYIDIFDKIKAPFGTFSVTGNHDYGDYVRWSSPEAKRRNFRALQTAHKELGWNLLMNENHILEEKGEKIAVLGVENWSNKGKFPKYGKINEAEKGTDEAAVKILLSHDPSHWEGQVLADYKDIDLMLAGHTHGMQFGIEIPGFFRWSPVQYMYKQWAGMYKQDAQYLYVNRGYGYIGFPGRIGMPPEITIIELKKA